MVSSTAAPVATVRAGSGNGNGRGGQGGGKGGNKGGNKASSVASSAVATSAAAGTAVASSAVSSAPPAAVCFLPVINNPYTYSNVDITERRKRRWQWRPTKVFE